MNKEIKEAWLVLATLFNLPSKWFVKDFIDIYTKTNLQLYTNYKGIYVVFKGVNNIRDKEFGENSNCLNPEYVLVKNQIYTIYFIKVDDKNKIQYDLLNVLGSKALSSSLICQIAIQFTNHIGNTFNNILDVITFAKILNKESLGVNSQAFIFNLILQILLS